MPTPFTSSIGTDLIREASRSKPACLIEANDFELAEGADWSWESEVIAWRASEADLYDVVDLTGCTATARITTKRDGVLITNLTSKCTANGTVIVSLSSAASVLALNGRGRRTVWWECELKMPDGRIVWLWRGTFNIDQKGLR